MDNVFKRAAIALGFIDEPVYRSATPELPIIGSNASFVNPVNLTTASGYVSADRALSLPGVMRAIQVKSTAVMQLELQVWRNGVIVPQPTTSLVVQPNIGQTLAVFLQETVNSLNITGNAYWLQTKTAPDAAVQNLSVLDPLVTSIGYDDKGNKFFREGDTTYPAWRVQHLKYERLPGYQLGVGPIQTHQNELRNAIALRNYTENWFSDNRQPAYYLKTDQILPPGKAQEYAEAWQTALANGITPVLGGNLTAVPMALNPEDAQFIENQKFMLSQEARIFGVPGTLLDLPVGDSQTYSNRVDTVNDFYRFGLKKELTEIEGAFSVLLPRGQTARFDVSPLLGLEAQAATPDAPVDSNANNNIGDTQNDQQE